jgi:quercetin dioxygenase-like cupin family protein
MPGASSGMEAHLDMDEILYVVAGEGMLYHCLTDGSPVIARPLRPGDAVLVRGGIYHSIANKAESVGSSANTNWPGGEGPPLEEPLCLIVIGLKNAWHRYVSRLSWLAAGPPD